MAGSLVCLVTLTLGMDVGWRQLPDGGMEYIIQIEPHVLDSLRMGAEIESDIPPNVRDLRKYRIVVGTGKLPRDASIESPPEQSLSPQAQSADPEAASARYGETSPQFPPWTHAPKTLPPSTDMHRLGGFPEKPIGFVESREVESRPVVNQGEAGESEKAAELEEPETPAGTVSLTLAALSASCVGGMFFVGWVAWDYRRQYHALLRRVLDGGLEGVAMDDVPISEAERQAASASPKSS